jgi:hypothetical protein
MKSFFTLALCLLALLSPAAAPAQTPAAAAPAQTPAAAAPVPAPLPAIPALLHDVELHQQFNERVAQNYIYRSTQTLRDRNGRTRATESEYFTINGVLLRRVLSRDGKPLPPQDAGKEQERVDKAVAKAKARQVKAEDRGKETDSSGETLISASRLLELSTVSNPRRQQLNGRSVIVFDFTGNRSMKTHSIAEGILKSVNGTAWIDEKDRELARITATMPETFRVGWGLIAEISKGSTVTAEFAPVRGEVWLPARLNGQGHACVLLLDDVVDGSLSVQYADYRKFGTSITIRPLADNPIATPEADPAPQPTSQPQP